MKLLDGAELTGFMKEQQAHQVRGLRQAHGLNPQLVITPAGAADGFVKLCQDYGQDIVVNVDTNAADQDQTAQLAAARATAVNWLLAGYNVDLAGKVMLLVGQDASLNDLVADWEAVGCQVLQMADQAVSEQPVDVLVASHVNDTQPVSQKAVAIETSGEGFVELMICALFDNVIRAARATITA